MCVHACIIKLFNDEIPQMGRRSVERKRAKRWLQKKAKKRKLALLTASKHGTFSSKSSLPMPEQSSPCQNVDIEEQSSTNTLGSPESPSCLTEDEGSPSTVKHGLEPCTASNCQPEIDLFGVDMAIHHYDEVEKCVESNKSKLNGEGLVEHLLECNRTLADKVVFYQRRSERAETKVYDEQFECSKKVHRVREFYRNMLYSDSRSAVMLRMATQSKKS